MRATEEEVDASIWLTVDTVTPRLENGWYLGREAKAEGHAIRERSGLEEARDRMDDLRFGD